MIIRRCCFLEGDAFQVEGIQQIETYILCQTLFSFRKSRRLLVNYKKNMVQANQPQIIKNGAKMIRFACRPVKTKYNNSNNTT